MKNQLVIFSLEPIETRYTKQWFTHLVPTFSAGLGDDWEVFQIDGTVGEQKATKGAFLNFLSTNVWKNEQANTFFHLVSNQTIRDNAVILITDFWNPVINEIRYVKELLNKSWKIVSLAHAGSYDPQDFLGRLIKDKAWVEHAEASFFEAADVTVFATRFHRSLFMKTYPNISLEKTAIAGFPMEYMEEQILPGVKEDLIVFPHRIAPEKQVELFDRVAEILPEYDFVVCQREGMSKTEYHEVLSKAKVVFSANLQETLGISTCGESLCANALPFAPDHLSYSEILPKAFLYPSHLATDKGNEERLAEILRSYVSSYESLLPMLQLCKGNILQRFFGSDELVELIRAIRSVILMGYGGDYDTN